MHCPFYYCCTREPIPFRLLLTLLLDDDEENGAGVNNPAANLSQSEIQAALIRRRCLEIRNKNEEGLSLEDENPDYFKLETETKVLVFSEPLSVTEQQQGANTTTTPQQQQEAASLYNREEGRNFVAPALVVERGTDDTTQQEGETVAAAGVTTETHPGRRCGGCGGVLPDEDVAVASAGGIDDDEEEEEDIVVVSSGYIQQGNMSSPAPVSSETGNDLSPENYDSGRITKQDSIPEQDDGQ